MTLHSPDFLSPTISGVDLRLYLVRHAAHADLGHRLTGRAPGVPLSPEGKRQARALGRRFGAERLTEIHTSPRARARETAEAIAKITGAELRIIEALDEIDFGAWTGAEFGALKGQKSWEAWNSARASSRCPGGESMAEAADRIGAHVAALSACAPGARIALVTHCDMIRALIASCLGLSYDNLLRFEIAPASVSRMQLGAWGAKLITLNETDASGTPE